MKYRGIKCPICDCDDFYAVRRTKIKFGCYCSNCSRWIKWLSVKDAKRFDNAGCLKTPVSENGDYK